MGKRFVTHEELQRGIRLSTESEHELVLRVVPFFDFRWLREDSRVAHLSARTGIPDGTPTRFTVYRWDGALSDPMPSSPGEPRPASPGEEIGGVDGEIRGGIAFARWMPPEGFDPFDYGAWLIDHDLDLESSEDDASEDSITVDDLLALPAARPPIFLVESGNHWGFSFPPGYELDRVHILEEGHGPGLAIGYDFGLIPCQASGGKVTPTNALPTNVRLMALSIAGRALALEG